MMVVAMTGGTGVLRSTKMALSEKSGMLHRGDDFGPKS